MYQQNGIGTRSEFSTQHNHEVNLCIMGWSSSAGGTHKRPLPGRTLAKELAVLGISYSHILYTV
jgi:hypothetical protein